jgi:hypothetical protein
MNFADILRCLADLTGIGLAGLIVVVGYMLTRQFIVLERNHMSHMEKSYDQLTDTVGRLANAQEATVEVARAQCTALEMNTSTLRAMRDLLELKR